MKRRKFLKDIAVGTTALALAPKLVAGDAYEANLMDGWRKVERTIRHSHFNNYWYFIQQLATGNPSGYLCRSKITVGGKIDIYQVMQTGKEWPIWMNMEDVPLFEEMRLNGFGDHPSGIHGVSIVSGLVDPFQPYGGSNQSPAIAVDGYEIHTFYSVGRDPSGT